MSEDEKSTCMFGGKSITTEHRYGGVTMTMDGKSVFLTRKEAFALSGMLLRTTWEEPVTDPDYRVIQDGCAEPNERNLHALPRDKALRLYYTACVLSKVRSMRESLERLDRRMRESEPTVERERGLTTLGRLAGFLYKDMMYGLDSLNRDMELNFYRERIDPGRTASEAFDAEMNLSERLQRGT